MAQVNVTINSRSYRMACDDGQEDHLRGLASQLNEVIDQLRGSFGEIGDQRLTVMAAITLADSLSEARRQIARLEAEVSDVRQTKSSVVDQFEGAQAEAARALETVAERIESAAVRLAGTNGA